MKDKNIIQLDGLRFFGVFTVMIAHWLQWQWNESLHKIPFTHGVLLFFVLSGFLITRILLNYKSKSSKRRLLKVFYLRRFFRIFPVYYALLFLLLIINFENIKDVFVWLFTYTTNIYQALNNINLGSFNHFWTLAVEEQFYLFWPFVILFVNQKHILKTIAFLILLSIGSKFYFYSLDYNWRIVSCLTINNLFALAIGGLLAQITDTNHKSLAFLSKTKTVLAFLMGYSVLLFLGIKTDLKWYLDVFDPFFFSLLSFLIILKASTNGFSGIIKKTLEHKFIVYSGKISYGLYLFHLFIPGLLYFIFPEFEEINRMSPFSKYFLFIVYYMVTFLIAHLSWIILEKPMNNLKSKYPYLKQN